MSRRDSGPPDWERGGGPTPEAARHHQRQSLARNQHPQPNAAPRHFGRYARTRRPADLWREGYCYGFLAALRDVARAVDDPEVVGAAGPGRRELHRAGRRQLWTGGRR